METSTLELPTGCTTPARWAAVAFVASYSSPGTRQAYATQLRLWFDWCDQHHLEPLAEVRHPHVELNARDLESRGLAAATVALKLVVLTGFYRYSVEEQLLEHSPAVHVRRPEALRVSEACGADLCDLALANGHRTLRIVGKGNQPALIPLAPRTARAIDTAVGERTEGPLLQRANGSRIDRHAAGRIVRRLANRAGIDKPISPHSLRHAARSPPAYQTRRPTPDPTLRPRPR